MSGDQASLKGERCRTQNINKKRKSKKMHNLRQLWFIDIISLLLLSIRTFVQTDFEIWNGTQPDFLRLW